LGLEFGGGGDRNGSNGKGKKDWLKAGQELD